MEIILAFWETLPERRKAALFALVIWLIYGLVIGIWEDE